MMLAERSVRRIAIRTSSSFWVVLRDASRLQCSVASSCARTDGETPSPGRRRNLRLHDGHRIGQPRRTTD
jgi:hypothetical protein